MRQAEKCDTQGDEFESKTSYVFLISSFDVIQFYATTNAHCTMDFLSKFVFNVLLLRGF